MPIRRLTETRPTPGLRTSALLSLAIVLAALSACGRNDALPAGLEQLKQGNYKAAVIELKNAVDQSPDSVEARLALADAMERSNDLPGAENQLRKALDNGADANVVVPRLAALLLDRNDLDKLVRDFKDRTLESPEADSSLRASVALAFMGQRRLPQAREQLAAAKARTPMVALARAQLLLAEGQREAALAELGGAKVEAGTPWWVLRALSRLAASMGDGATALATIRQAHEAAPWHVGLTGEYGDALLTAGKADEATAIRDKLKKAAPGHFWTHYLDASLLARAGRTDESLAAALKVLAVSPEHLPAALLAAGAELQKGDLLMAGKRLAALAKQHPDSLPTMELLAQAQLQNNEVDRALETVRRARAQAPKEPRFMVLEAEALLRKGDGKRAAALFAELVALQPDNPVNLLRLAELRAAQGDRAGAAPLLDRAAEAARKDPALMDRLVATAIKLRDLPRARQLADQAVAAQPDQAGPRLTLSAVQAAQQDYAGAWASTLAALDRNPASAPALQALARMARKPAERSELMARYAKAVDTKGAVAITFLEYAALLRQTKDAPATPLSVLEKGLQRLPDAVPLRGAVVEAYLGAGDAERALSTAQAGAAMANAPVEAQELQAVAYERLGKADQATRAYRSMVAAFPQRSDLKLKLAQLEVAAGRKADATTLLRAVITARPFEAPAYIALAQLTVADNPAEALSIARQMTARDELRTSGMVLEGDVLVRSRKPDEALEQYARAVKAGAMPVAAMRKVSLLDSLSRRGDADAELADLLRLAPKNTEVLGFAAQRALAAGQAARAADLMGQVVALTPRDPTALNDLAWAQVQARRPEALATARRAATLLPDNAVVLDTLGAALTQAGQHAEAVATLRRASALAPTAWPVKLRLAQALLAAGDRKAAADMAKLIPSEALPPGDKPALQQLNAALGT